MMTAKQNTSDPGRKRTRAEETDQAARAIIAAESQARDKKTEQLRILRLERQASQAGSDRRKSTDPSRTRRRPRK